MEANAFVLKCSSYLNFFKFPPQFAQSRVVFFFFQSQTMYSSSTVLCVLCTQERLCFIFEKKKVLWAVLFHIITTRCITQTCLNWVKMLKKKFKKRLKSVLDTNQTWSCWFLSSTGYCAAGRRGVGVTPGGKKKRTFLCLHLAAAPLSSHAGNTQTCTHINVFCLPACHHGNTLKL